MKRFFFCSIVLIFITEAMAQSINEIIPVKSLISKTKQPTRSKGLQYTFELGYNNALNFNNNGGNNDYEGFSKSFSGAGGIFVLTYKFNPNFYFGAGLGFQIIQTASLNGYGDYHGLRKHHSGQYNLWDGTMEKYSYHSDIIGEKIEGNRTNIFIRAAYRLNNKKVSPLLMIDGGFRLYRFDNTDFESDYDVDLSLSSSFFVSPSIGLSVRFSNNSYLELKAGYDFTEPIKEMNFEGESGSMDKKYENTTYYGKHYWKEHYDKINLSSFYVSIGFTHTLNLMPKTKHPKYQYNYAYFDTGQNQLDEESVKELFEQAYETPVSDYQKKYNLYMDVVKADPFNRTGYMALAYNNIGAIYENQGDDSKAVNYYRIATVVSPNLEIAKNNLERSKSNRNSKRLDAVINGLAVIGEGLQTISENMSSNESMDNDSYDEYNSSGNTGNRAKTNTNKVNHSNWKALDRAYGGYENQLIRMSSSGNIDRQEVKNIQRKMRETRQKIKEQSGHSRAISSWENWNP